MRSPKTYSAIRLQLLASAAFATLVICSGASAQQNAAQATGQRALTNQQISRIGSVISDASDSGITATVGAVDHASVADSDNLFVANSRANSADLSIAAAVSEAQYASPAGLSVSESDASVQSSNAIANLQSMTGTNVAADLYRAGADITAGPVSDGSLTVSGNEQDGTARGNYASSGINLGTAQSSGAGIATMQTMSSDDLVGARSRGYVAVQTGNIVESQVAASQNSASSLAYGNDTSNQIGGSARLLPRSSPSPASVVDKYNTGAASAGLAILSRQLASGIVKASGGTSDDNPSQRINVGGSLAASTVESDRNSVSAVATANHADSTVSIDAMSAAQDTVGSDPAIAALTASDPADGFASVTNIQTADGLTTKAFTWGGDRVAVSGAVSQSRLSVSDNATTTLATANFGSNALRLSAPALKATGLATASVRGEDGSTVDGAAVIHNVQDAGTSSVNAFQSSGGGNSVAVAGPIMSTTVAVDSNKAITGATANDEDSALELTNAPTGALMNVQSSDAGALATIGAATDPLIDRIASSDKADRSSLSVSGNTLAAAAIGNRAANTLSTSGDSGLSAGPAQGGQAGSTVGASVVTNVQIVGQPRTSAGMPSIVAAATAQDSIDASSVSASRIALDDNLQRTAAVANTAVNRISVAGTDDGGSGVLASSQSALANVAANSEARLAAPVQITESSVSISDSTNLALAVANDADNGLSSAMPGNSRYASDATLMVDLPSGSDGIGENIVINNQLGGGSVSAAAATHISPGSLALSLDASSLTLSGNATSAEADANRATNAVNMTATEGGVANRQFSTAAVNATVTTDLFAGSKDSAEAGVTGSTVTISGNDLTAVARGNAADNRITSSVSGAVAPLAVGATGGFSGFATGASSLLNAQANYGPVLATADGSGLGIPLNGVVVGSNVSVGGSTVNASASGNSSANGLIQTPAATAPSASLANLQTNYGNVTAAVTGSAWRASTGALTSTALLISGSQISATAVGNQTVNAVTVGR